jgi:hypothetical protein
MIDHPITPPTDLLSRWEEDWHHSKVKHVELEDHIATQAAQWGADTELEACCEWLQHNYPDGTQVAALWAFRRPKPPSLKERLSKAIIDGDEREVLKLLEELDDSL